MKFKKFYIYIYLDPRKCGNYKYPGIELTYEPFYVGKGSNIRYKAYSHLCHSRFFDRKIRKIGIDNIIIKKISNLSEESAFNHEKELIAIIGRKDLKLGPLLNLTDGGEGTSGHIHSEKFKKRLSKLHKEKLYTKYRRGELSPNKKLSQKNVDDILLYYSKGYSRKNIAKLFPVCYEQVCNIIRGVSWV